MFNWDCVTREHVIKAIRKFDRDRPKVPPAKNTFLRFEGKVYPAKHIRGMAYEIANNRRILKSQYSGGLETVRFFQGLGFEVVYNKKLISGMDKLHTYKTLLNKNMCNKSNSESITQKQFRTDYDKKKYIKNEENNNINYSDNKIKISSKNVVEQKNAFQAVLNRVFNGDIISEKAYTWMKTPGIYQDIIYERLIDKIRKYRGDSKFVKLNYSLKCDFACDSRKIIFEYDERQHFSNARKIALESYKDSIVFNYDAEKWIKACDDINAKDNSPVNRDEVRAFYDSVRDIEASKNGYRLIRIMHGQFDWNSDNAEEYLNALIMKNYIFSDNKSECMKVSINNSKFNNELLKVGLFLQYFNEELEKSIDVIDNVKDAGLDLLVFPECCYTSFNNDIDKYNNITTKSGYDEVKKYCMNFSRKIGCPIIYSSCDYYGTMYSIYVNPYAEANETEDAMYIKHTATENSAFNINYKDLINKNFPIIKLKDIRIGMTICYDCSHPLFSRMYGAKGVDIIINSTGGNVNKVKWYRYNKVRAIENNCFNLCTMGYEKNESKNKSYTFAIGPKGKKLDVVEIIGHATSSNVPDNIYVYNIDLNDKNGYEEDFTIKQDESVNKKQNLIIKMENIDDLLKETEKISDNIYILNNGKENIIIGIVHESEILKPENICSILFSSKLKNYKNKKYLIINNWDEINDSYFKNVLSDILKARATENFIGLILNSSKYKKCYQSGNIKNAQVVKMIDGCFAMDTSRMGGPESLWKNKTWRDGYELLLKRIENIIK